MASNYAASAEHADETRTRAPCRVIFVGIGGASCSGKTSLATHLLRILPPGSFIVHQVRASSHIHSASPLSA